VFLEPRSTHRLRIRVRRVWIADGAVCAGVVHKGSAMTVEAFPLQWPVGWDRTPSHKRSAGAFSITLAKARDGIVKEVKLLGGRHLVINSNLQLRNDGLPYASQPRLVDQGIAVYFEYKGKPMCFACDRYARVEANLRAIELTIAALRGIDRWGASDMMERAFTGFTALEHAPEKGWREILGVSVTAQSHEIDQAYRRLRSQFHPDHGGNSEQFQRVQWAYEQAQKGAP
jgi:hypothetical protein